VLGSFRWWMLQCMKLPEPGYVFTCTKMSICLNTTLYKDFHVKFYTWAPAHLIFVCQSPPTFCSMLWCTCNTNFHVHHVQISPVARTLHETVIANPSPRHIKLSPAYCSVICDACDIYSSLICDEHETISHRFVTCLWHKPLCTKQACRGSMWKSNPGKKNSWQPTHSLFTPQW